MVRIVARVRVRIRGMLGLLNVCGLVSVAIYKVTDPDFNLIVRFGLIF